MLIVPGSLRSLKWRTAIEVRSHDKRQAIQSENQRSHSFNSAVRPLTLRFHAQVLSYFAMRHLLAPSSNIELNDFFGWHFRVSGKQSKQGAVEILRNDDAHWNGIIPV
jgi:hypothetical protein